MNEANTTTGMKKEIAAIIVAAGFSSRMKAFKPLLPLNNTTVLETTIGCFMNAGINDIVVVLGFNADKIKPILEKRNIKWVYNECYSEGMYTSVRAGVSSLPSNIKAFFFMPADIPLVQSKTIDALCHAYWQNDKAIIFPTFNERRGHPPLISAGLIEEIKEYDGLGGLKALLGKHKDKSYYLEVEDEGILLDIDTFEDYEKLDIKSP